MNLQFVLILSLTSTSQCRVNVCVALPLLVAACLWLLSNRLAHLELCFVDLLFPKWRLTTAQMAEQFCSGTPKGRAQTV